MIEMTALQAMEEEAKRVRGRPDDAWIGQYHLGTDMALELIDLARCELMRRAQAQRGKQASDELPETANT